MLSNLPNDLILKIFSHLGTIPDIARTSQVSKALYNSAQNPKLWMEVAIRKYGNQAARQTIDLYKGDWKKMLQDDNREGVHPTVERVWKSNYVYNHDDYYFVCLVTAIQYDRTKEEILVYIDARGEWDLRAPITSSICSADEEVEGEYTNDSSLHACKYRSFLQEETRGHYKGVLSFQSNQLDMSGRKWNFLFANHYPVISDYESITILDIEEGKSIYETLQQMDGFEYLPKEQHLFVNDTPQVEHERWEPHVPSSVLQSNIWRRGIRGWWV